MIQVDDSYQMIQNKKLERSERVGEWCKSKLNPVKNQFKQNFVNLEIGCGHGHWLSSFALDCDSEVFIGIDLITKRVEKAKLKCDKRFQQNILFLKAEASEFLESSNLSISKTFIMYPDPWPKSKHHKRRLIQGAFLDLLASKTIHNGLLYFMTDHEPYFKWSLLKIEQSTNWNIVDLAWPHNAFSYFSDLLPERMFFCAKVT